MSFNFGTATTTSAGAFGTNTASTGGFPFGSGDSKSLFGGAANTENKPAFNFTSTTTSAPTFGAFSFGAKTTTTTSSLFSTPAAAPAPAPAPSFGASKPLGFGFASPPNQTVGSPGFGAPAQNAAQNLSFGGGTQQQAAPAFGSPAQGGTPFGSPGSGFAFGQGAATTGLAFSTPTATISSAPQQGQSTFDGAATTAVTGFGQTTAFAKPAVSFGTAPAFGSPNPPAFGSPVQPLSLPQTLQPQTQQPQMQQPQMQQPQTQQPQMQQPQTQPLAQTQPQMQLQQQTQGLSFGQAQPTAFGQPTQPQNTGIAFGATTTPQSTLSFGTTSQPAATSQPNLSQPNLASTPNLNFGKVGFASPATTASLSFGQPQASSLSFVSPAVTSQATSAAGGISFAPTTQSANVTKPTTFGTPPASGGLSFGTSAPPASTGLGFGAPTSSAPVSTGLSFGTSSAGLGFGAPASTAAAPTGLSLSTAASTPASTTGLSFGTTTSQPAGLNFGTPATSAQPGLSFGAPSAAKTSAGFGAPASSAPVSVGNFGAPTTAASAGISFGTVTTSVTSTVAASSAPSLSLGKSTAASTIPSLAAPTTTTAAPPQPFQSITFAQLEENINKFTLELEEQEKTFINQATQINAWDRLLIANGEKIVELNDAVESVKSEQQGLEQELDFVLGQQNELEELLAPIEKQLLEETGDVARDPERERMYSLAENLDTQLRQMSEDLKEVIEHLNETNRGQDGNDPIVQIGRILNAHMSSMQWIDNSIAQISTKLDQLKATHDTLRRDNERSFQLTYN